MIQKLNIRNFQSHKDSALEFHPGVNVIVGRSDSGKTAILRALRWLIWNRPGGDDFRSDWGGNTVVKLTVDDRELMRGKAKENVYSIEQPGGGHKMLMAFGKDVPEEIQKALNIDETNLQKQFDAPFLLTLSPGAVAGHFNKIAHLDQIDSSVSYVNGKILKIGNIISSNTDDLTSWEEELEKYKYLDKFEIDLEDLEHRVADMIETVTSQNRLKKHLESMEENADEIQEVERIAKLGKPVDRILKLYEEKKEKNKELIELRRTLGTIVEMDKFSKSLSKKIELKPQAEALLKLHKERKEAWQDMLALKTKLRELRSVTASETSWETTIDGLITLFNKHMPDVCPLCGNKTAG
jgi:DNA repair exonuclease SbcCD ATPase subunit